MGQDWDMEVTQQLPSWANLIQLGEMWFISNQTEQDSEKQE